MQANTKIRAVLGGFILFSLLMASGCAEHEAGTAAPSGSSKPAALAPQLIATGVTVGGVSVGGLTLDQAKAKIVDAERQKSATANFKLRDKATKRTFHYSPREFGGYFDTDAVLSAAASAAPSQAIPLSWKVDPRKVRLHVARIADLLDVPAQEPHVHFVANGGFEPGKGHSGRALDIKSTVALACSNPDKPVNLPFRTQTPKLMPDDLHGIGDTLISFTTTFHPSQSERTNNLTLAAHNIDGTTIAPGGVFSYNDSVGPRTHETGFKDAIIYVNNRMKKDVGGGICQVSSTLYNCVLLANLPVVERHPHSLPVHYVEAGRDATVAWGGDDFKFRNTTSRPIIVRAIVHGGTLTEMLIGDKSAVSHPDAQVAIRVSPRRTYPDGYAVTAYRIVKEGGTLVAREPLGTSFYHNPIGGLPH